jgi:hypothetical protein
MLLMRDGGIGGGSRGLFSRCTRFCTCAGGQMVGTSHDDESRPTARDARSSRRGARDARRHLRLVHRGLRHRRPEGRQDAA